MSRFARPFAVATVVACLAVCLAACLVGALACDEDKKTTKADAVKPAATQPAAPPATPSPTAKPARRRMPEVSLHTMGVNLGLDELKLSVPSFDVALKSLLKQHPVDEPDEVIFNVDRKVKTPVATKVYYALIDAGAKKIEVRTTPRSSFPNRLVIAPEKSVGDDILGCTYVGMILENLGATFWQKDGGRAKRYAKGMAGPDLTVMHEVMHKEAKTCNSKVFLFSASDDVDWGHAYDIACSVKAADPPYEHIDQFVLLREAPVPGTPVKIKP